MAHAHCILGTEVYRHTLRICNIYCCPTSTMVARTHVSVTLYVHCLSGSVLFCDRKSRYRLWYIYLYLLTINFAVTNFMTLEDWVDRLSRNASKGLPLYAALFPRIAQILYTLWWKPEVMNYAMEIILCNKCTIISQIITHLHVLTLSCHPQGACNQYLANLHTFFRCSCW